jgi:SAM-dependent methyltransferase
MDDFMSTKVPYVDEAIPSWEKLSNKSRFVRYASEIERLASLKALQPVATPIMALDIGCEGGRFSKILADLGWKLICTDISENYLKVCQQRLPGAACVLISPDDTTLPADTGSIGLILYIEVAPVIHADWFPEEAFRVLQKGGLIVGVVWNNASFRGLLRHLIDTSKGNFDWYPFSYREWRQRFCGRGFTIQHTGGSRWFPFRRISNSPLIPIFARFERFLGLRKLVRFSPFITFIARKD